MKDLLVSALLSLNIDCSVIRMADQVPGDAWKTEVCRSFHGYSGVKLKAIRNISKKHAMAAGRNDIQISQPIAGRLTVGRSGRSTTNEEVWFTTFYIVQAYKEVWVAKRDIGRNTVIKRSDIFLEKRQVGTLIGLKELPIESPAGSYTESRLAKGKIIFKDQLATEPLVAEGKEIDALLAEGSIRIRARGIALQNGFLKDDLIKVKLLSTGKITAGKVIDNETVVLDM